jgi:FDF domain
VLLIQYNIISFFSGKIVKAEVNQLTITNAFLNGVKIKKFDYHVTIACEEIESISFIQVVNPATVTSSTHNNNSQQNTAFKNNTNSIHSSNNTKKSPPNLCYKKPNQNDGFRHPKTTTKPIAVRKNASTATTATENSQNKRFSKKRNKNYDLLQPEDFSDQGDFDFESNNAMFDKQSVYQEIEEQIYGKNPVEKPDLVRQIGKTEEKYRHDENVLDSMLMQFRNIQLEFKPKQEYTTDEACIIIPSIPKSLRNRIQNLAAEAGYLFERQNDFLARGATELALQVSFFIFYYWI